MAGGTSAGRADCLAATRIADTARSRACRLSVLVGAVERSAAGQFHPGSVDSAPRAADARRVELEGNTIIG